MRLWFFGTPPDAVASLRLLVEGGHEVVGVVTQPDRRRGRGGTLVPSAIKEAAIELGVPVHTPTRAVEVVPDLEASGADLGVVVAFGQLLPPSVLGAFRHGMVNVHFSLLPRWRGAAPVERAVLAGDDETGVCIMAVEPTLDTGAVYARRVVPIGADDTSGDLRARLSAAGAELLAETIDDVPSTEPVPQVGEPTVAPKLTVEEFRLDWNSPALDLVRRVRAGNPRPGAWTTDGDRRLKVWRARPLPTVFSAPSSSAALSSAARSSSGAQAGNAAGAVVVLDGAAAVRTVSGELLELTEVQPEGRARMSGTAWLGGRRSDARLGAS